jgi:probable HAF family extracellular repeat protein
MISVRGVAMVAMVAAVVVLTLHGRAALAEVKYTLQDLGTLGGSDSWSAAVNDSGEVAGGSTLTPGGGLAQAYVYKNGLMKGLGSLGGLSIALGMNNAGVVVGRSNLSDNVTSLAFRWDSVGGMVNLGTLGGAQSGACGINTSGDIVGWAQNTAGYGHAFSRIGIGLWYDLGTLGGDFSVALGINDNGQIAGYSTAIPGSGSPLRATYWSSSTSSPVDIGTLGGQYAEACAINNSGVIVGYSYLLGNVMAHAFIYSGGVMTDLTRFGGWSQALGLNDAGDVVGSSRDALNVEHAFLYSGGVVTDLNTVVQCPAGQYLRIANDINSSGQIAAQVYDMSTGAYRAVLLTPVPEPATLALLAVGGLMALRRRR